MKRIAIPIVLLLLAAIGLTIGYRMLAQTISHRVQTKIARVQAGTDAWTAALSLDTRELFFHKKVDGTFVIYRAERRSS